MEFKQGPFTLSSRGSRWTMFYGSDELAMHTLITSASQADVLEAFEQDRADFIRRTQAAFALPRIDLIDFETGDDVASFYSHDMCGMTPGLVNDRARYWIRSADRRYSRDVTLTQFAHIVAQHQALPSAWILELLPQVVVTNDPAEWRAPTSWELRHVVGEGSFTGVSGAKAAELIGVTPQNFRKYTAADGASTRQNMGFAMWHLLLQKLGVKQA